MSFEDDEYWASDEAWLTEASLERANERTRPPRQQRSDRSWRPGTGRWAAPASGGPYNEAPAYEPADELAARRRRRPDPAARGAYRDGQLLDDRYPDERYPDDRYLDDRHLSDRDLDDRHLDQSGRAWWRDDDEYPARPARGTAAAPSWEDVDPSWDDLGPDRDASSMDSLWGGVDLDRRPSHDPYRRPPEDRSPAGAPDPADRPATGRARVPAPRADRPPVELDRGTGRAGPRPRSARHRDDVRPDTRPESRLDGRSENRLDARPAGWAVDGAQDQPAHRLDDSGYRPAAVRDPAADRRDPPRVVGRGEAPAAPRVISRSTPPPAPRVISAAPQNVAPRAVTPSPPPTVAAVSRAAPAAPAKVVPPAPAVPPARVVRQEAAPPVPRIPPPGSRPSASTWQADHPVDPPAARHPGDAAPAGYRTIDAAVAQPAPSWFSASPVDPPAGGAEVIALPGARAADRDDPRPSARTDAVGTDAEAGARPATVLGATDLRNTDPRNTDLRATDLRATDLGFTANGITTDRVTTVPEAVPRQDSAEIEASPAPVADALLGVLSPDSLLPATLLPGPEPTEQQPVPDPVQTPEAEAEAEPAPEPQAEQPSAEVEFAAIRWRLDGATLREVVEDHDALRALGARLDLPLTEATDDSSQARLLCLRAGVYRLLGELGMAAAASRLALTRAEATGSPDSVVIAQAELAHVLRLRGDFTEADRLFEEAASAEVPGLLRCVVHENAGRSCFDQGRHMEALDHFTRAIRLGDPEDLDLVQRIEVALEAVYIRVLRDGWGPYPRLRRQILDPSAS